jgi:hypothetical protein
VSRTPQSAVEADLTRRGLTYFELNHDFGSPDESERPYIKARTLRIDSFTAYGQHGRLDLDFIDDELARTLFWPNQANEFEVALKQRGLFVGEGEEVEIEPATILRLAGFAPSNRSWSWSDKYLDERTTCWVMFYS